HYVERSGDAIEHRLRDMQAVPDVLAVPDERSRVQPSGESCNAAIVWKRTKAGYRGFVKDVAGLVVQLFADELRTKRRAALGEKRLEPRRVLCAGEEDGSRFGRFRELADAFDPY